MEAKILREPPFKICLYCGEEIPIQIRKEYESYYECDCVDAKKEREIREKIRKLELELPKPKFGIMVENVLYKLNEYGEI